MMSNRSETFGRLLKGAINSIAAYEGKSAPAVEEDLGTQIGLAGSALQRYKAGNLPPDLRTLEVIAAAAVRRAFLGRAWLQVFLQATRYPSPEALIARLIGDAPAPTLVGTALPSGTVTFLFTDIVGSTRLWEEQASAMQRALARHDAILRQAISEHGGHVFKTVGDAFCAAFATAPAALQAAIAIQRYILAEPWSASGLPEPIMARTVLHTGAAEEREGDYFGPPLNRVARLCGVGHGGQVLLSLAAQELTRDQLPPGAELRDLGEQRMKDLARPERIFQLVLPDLPAEFPPLKTLNAYRHNLPAQLTALIGREREVEDLSDLLRQPDLRLLTLSGPGGTGKTRLALQAAGELVEQFADGVWFVGLAPISDPALVAGTIASTFGLREQSDRPIAELLRDYLREKALLLLLDNFEQVLSAAPLVAELLASAPRLKVLVTSRVVLHLYGEREYAVPPLSLPERIPPPSFERMTQYEAVRLFIERARAVRADFAVTAANAPQIAEICHRLDGLPLAIELAAARSKLFAPQAILNRLDKRLATLTGGAHDQPARQQTLRGAIDWSYDLLDAAEQESFTRLGVFVGGCTLNSAEAVLTAGGDILVEPLDMLSSLVDKSLLKQIEGPQGEPRFFMLETIREYALERLAAGDSAAISQRAHAEYFAALAEFVSPQSESVWLARLNAEHDNLRAALICAVELPAEEIALRLAASLGWFWMRHGYWSEGRIWLQIVSPLMGAAAPSSNHANVLFIQGFLAQLQGDIALGQVFLEESLAMHRQVGDLEGSSMVLLNMGVTARERGDVAQATALFEQALHIPQQRQDAEGIAWVQVSLGEVAILREDALGATDLLDVALAQFRKVESYVGVAWTLNHLGHVAQLQGDYARAAAFHHESLGLFSGSGTDQSGVGWALEGLGTAALAQGHLRAATTQYTESLRTFQELGDPGIIWSLAGLGSVAAMGDQAERAARLWGATEALRERSGKRVAPASRATYESALAAAQAQLGNEAFAAAWAAGRALSIDEAVAEALAAAG